MNLSLAPQLVSKWVNKCLLLFTCLLLVSLDFLVSKANAESLKDLRFKRISSLNAMSALGEKADTDLAVSGFAGKGRGVS